MRVWTVVEGETFDGYDTRWLCVDNERVADLGEPEHPTLDLAQFIVDACNAAEQREAEKGRDLSNPTYLTETVDPRRVSYRQSADGSEDWHITPR